uniref:Uncharacterized protein n=1 Tax=Denticeps clupeoides TaxID=299321 RepID=A0AAY4DBU1_9TELE
MFTAKDKLSTLAKLLCLGEALLPYFHQILVIFNIFKDCNENLGHRCDFGQWKNNNIAKLIRETLQLMDYYGGPIAMAEIKYMVPTFNG